MRVVVASDSIGSLTSAQAGAVLATGWAKADVTVVAMGEAGKGFVAAMADQLSAEVVSGVLGERLVSWVDSAEALIVSVEPPLVEATTGIDYQASSFGLGRAVREAIQSSRRRHLMIIIDLAGARTHDGGAGLLAALGALADVPLDAGVDGLQGLGSIDLTAALELLAGAELVGIVPDDQSSQPLLGLRGITSLKGREAGVDAEKLLATDAALERFAQRANPEALGVAGIGACGGTGFAIAALGGRLSTGPAFTAAYGGLAAAVRGCDLVVTGCSAFDFAGRGGGVMAEAARAAGDALCPCIAVAGEVVVGGREMRTMGIESAYAVRESALDLPTGGDITVEELGCTAARIARSWSW